MRFRELPLTRLIRSVGDAEITGVSIDSRKSAHGDAFVALLGKNHDGHAFIETVDFSAVIVGNQRAADIAFSRGIPFALVEDTVEACWQASKAVYGDPTSGLNCIGVTGTNGKTTVAWLLAQAISALGEKCAYLGTLGEVYAGDRFESDFTTPFPPDSFRRLRDLRSRGAECVAMEVSSHALEQRRVDGIDFRTAVFTNLTQDHLDLHESMDAYFAAKKRLFTDMPTQRRPKPVVNTDDSYGAKIFRETGGIDFGKEATAVRIIEGTATPTETLVTFRIGGRSVRASIQIGADFNVYNCAAVMATLWSMGHEPEAAAEALRHASPPPGRFESVPTSAEFDVVIDYAHTPDALEKLLRSSRALDPTRLVVVFGCGGDRDQTKRPKMGAIATSIADVAYVTSDNPRTEDPDSIISQILTGTVRGARIEVVPDRAAAIGEAIRAALPGDLIIVAGKGHEDYQIIGTEKIHLDDREVAAAAIQERVACA